MSLTARLTAFFLAAVALLLTGFSLALWLVERSNQYRRVDDRLDAALKLLAAGVEFDSGGLEWEPNERLLALEDGDQVDRIRWLVRDDRGATLQRSRNLPVGGLLERWSERSRIEAGPNHYGIALDGDSRVRIGSRLLTSPVGVEANQVLAKDHHRALRLTVGLSLAPVQASLRGLARLLTLLSVAVGALAVVLGRGFGRRALVPVTRMAQAARAIDADGHRLRLPESRNGDELEDLGDSFNGLLGRLEEAFERQRRFTGDASHQLRTPLAAMLGQVEVALRRERPAEDYRRTLERVRDQAEHLSQIVAMLLFLARADAESELPDRERIELRGWVERQLEGWRGHRRWGDLRLADPPSPHPWVQVHPPLLAQLLQNLLENACKYGEEGSPIVVRIGRGPEGVELSVEDTGQGIAADDLARVFEPFYRAASARRAGKAGVGLGLAVAARIASAFDGKLTAASETGRGSRFTVWLPEAAGDLDDGPASEGREEAGVGSWS